MSSILSFTPGACRVLRLALSEAYTLGHPSMGTGHLLLGLLQAPEGLALRVLTSLGAEAATVYTLLVDQLGCAEEPYRGEITLLPEAKRALTLAAAEARALGAVAIDTEHLLLGVLLVEEAVGAAVLEQQEVWLRHVHREIRRLQPG